MCIRDRPVPVLGDVAPFELPHVAQPQTAVAGEKISTFDVLPFAGCHEQSLHLVDSPVLPLPSVRLRPFVAREAVHRVGRDDTCLLYTSRCV